MSSRVKTTSAAPRSSSSEAPKAPQGNDRHAMVDRQGFAVGCDDTPIFYRVRELGLSNTCTERPSSRAR